MENKRMRLVSSHRLALYVIIALHSSFSLGQYGQSAATRGSDTITIGGEVERPIKLSRADFSKLARKKVRAKDHSGKEAEYEGAVLVDVLRLAGVKFGEQMRGPSLALYLVVEAADGYKAVFALPELDPAFTDRVIILADHRDGKALEENEGPYRIVVPDEKRQARWVRQVIALTIRRGL
jgi:hypothetical protein